MLTKNVGNNIANKINFYKTQRYNK